MAHVSATPDWSVYWHSRPMPILETSSVLLKQMLHRADRVQVEDVAAVALADPLLTLQVLRYMSQRPRSSLAAEVVSIQSIIMLMGTLPFLERFSNLPTAESILLPDHQALYTDYLQWIFLSRLSVRLALVYADWRYDARPEEIEVSALLSHATELLELFSKLDKKILPSSGELDDFLARLGIPGPIVQLLGSIDNAPPRVLLQRATLLLLKNCQYGWWQDECQQQYELIAGLLNVESQQVWSALCQTLLHFARESEPLAQVRQPARWLPMLPGEWSDSQPANSVVPDHAEGKVQPDKLTALLQSLHLARGKIPAKDILALTLRALTEGLTMQRIVFVMLTPGLAELRTRYVLGVSQEHPLRQMTIRLDQPNLFSKLLEKPQSLWLNEANAGHYLPHVPIAFRDGFASGNFFVMSIFAGTKPLGVIATDQGANEALSEFQYQHFKQICLLTSRALAP